MKQYLMAVDAGTGSIRAVIFDTDGNQIASEQREWTHLQDPRYPDSMNFDVETNYTLALTCIAGAIKKSGIDGGSIVAVSSTSMREGIVLYDRDGKEIWSCANVDARAKREVGQIKAIREGVEADIYHISGQGFALGSLPRLLWVKNNMPDVYAKTAAVTMIDDWINYKLSGILSTEPSNGCTTGIFSLKDRKWNIEIAKQCGIKEDIFPKVYESGTVIGKVTREVAEATGLSENCLVVAGGGDAQLGCVGVGAVHPGQAALFGGSFWQLEYNMGKPVTDDGCRIRVNCHAVPDLWQFELLAFYPGLVMRWFRDAFCQLEKLVEKETGVDAYYLLDKEASSVPVGSNGVFCTFSDVMNYLSWKHAAPSFINFGIDAEKFDKKVFYHSILENAALVSLGHMKLVQTITGHYPQEIIFASGASKSSLWCQIVADVLGVKLKVPKVKEATALGTSVCAGVGAGIYSSIAETASRVAHIEKVYEPNSQNHQIYLEIYRKWRTIYKTELVNSDIGLTSHMWKAPGL